MTASDGMMPRVIARYNARRQSNVANPLNQHPDAAELEEGEVLGTMQRLVGPAATLRLLEEYGGTRMFVPKVAKDATKIVTLIGLRPAEVLCEQFGGRYVRVRSENAGAPQLTAIVGGAIQRSPRRCA